MSELSQVMGQAARRELNTKTSCSSATAFVTPLSAKPLYGATSRRAVSGHVCRSRPTSRRTLVMKKFRRGTTEDDSNAVDVFAGNNQSQEELLAAALEENPATKKKKKKISNVTVEESDNAVDVFGGTQLSQKELLANALADESTTPKSKKKKKKGGIVTNDEDNAVDVFGGTDKTQEELLAEALGETEASSNIRKKKNKAKKGKQNSNLDEDSNAVEVFDSVEKSQNELLADASGGRGADKIEVSKPTQSDKKHKKKKGVIRDEESTVDGFNAVEKNQDHLLSESCDEASNGNISLKIDNEDPYLSHSDMDVSSSAKNGTGGAIQESDKNLGKVFSTKDISSLDLGSVNDVNATDEHVSTNGVEDENFEPDQDVIDEFTKTTMEFADYTPAGRREKARSSRNSRSDQDKRMMDPKRANFGSGGEKYTSVRLEDVVMTFRNTTILNGVTWGIHTGERVGLIGENGCGKTTQLRMIAGLVQPTSGEVVRSSSKTKASFLRQEFVDELDPTRTLREEFLSAFKEESKLLFEYEECERSISNAGEDMEKLEKLLNRLEDLRVQCEQKNAWNLDSRVDKVMPGLGFHEDDNDKLVASFSGGWKVRIGLGKVLLQDPDLLLLDEPSNHLDSESIEWLEAFLQTCKLPMVVVSHDREFLDRVCTKIVEIESGEAFEYPGNYSTYVKLRKEQRTAWEAAYDRQQRFLKEQTDFIKRNRRNPARSSQVKSREKMLERMERTGEMVRRPPRQGKPLVFRFPPAPRSGRDCIIIEDLMHGYGGRLLFEDASIAVERGDRIALIGPNGSGKSTLLRLITGRENPQEGTVECEGLTNISLAYYEQNQADALDLEITVLQTLKDAAPMTTSYEEIRALLGKFLFKGDDVEKQVGALSGGEKARLALAKIMLKPSNVLVLDEPGNHLSISAKEMLEEALQHFDGTLLLVSHDRYLISQVATQIIAIEDKQLVLYDGDYKSYMEKNQELKERLQARFIPGVAEIKNAPKVVIEQPIEAVEKKVKRKKNFGGSGVKSGKSNEMNAKRWNR